VLRTAAGKEVLISEPEIFWEILIQLIEDGQVIPVVGRDLLTIDGSRKLLYSYLAEKLAIAVGVSPENLPVGDELNEVACRYITAGNRVEDIYPALKTITSKAEIALSVPEPLLKLAAICPLRLFVTTTFDSFLVKAINQVRFDGTSRTRIIAHSPAELQDLPRDVKTSDLTGTSVPLVYHLMGKLSATPAYAVTQEDFVEFFHSLQSDTHRPPRLFDELSHQSLLILGCSFGGWLTRFLMRMSKGQRLSAGGKNDYVADVRVSSDESLVLFLRNFSRTTRIYRSGGVLDFVEELHNRWMRLHPVAPVSQGTLASTASGPAHVKAGRVFLSYAKEDAPIVREIGSALEAAGVDVFLDSDDLKPGEDWELKLRRNISQCALFLPVISRRTLTPERRFFRAEWNLAVKEAQMVSFSDEAIFILPVVIDDTSMDHADVPEKFRSTQWQLLPGGQPTPEFLACVQQLYRNYQKSRAIGA
jgi:TIR domain/SIR2-like domain